MAAVPRRERVARTLTFWLRPEFVLRVVNRFQKIAGFDRSIALASSALTAIVPLAIVVSSVMTKLGAKGTADRVIDRYDLTGAGAEAVRDILAPTSGADTGLGIAGAFFLLLALLSFSRTVQRLVEQTWELKPLSVRNSLNGLLWIGGLSVYAVVSGLLHAIGRTRFDVTGAVASLPVAAIFYVWSGRLLSGKRLSSRELIPFGIVGAVLSSIYSVGASIYLPHLFSTYTTRYGVIGGVFAMISGLFCVMVVLVGSASLGREIYDELDRIRRGERPAEDEVRRQWAEITAEGRSRWNRLRERRTRSRERAPSG